MSKSDDIVPLQHYAENDSELALRRFGNAHAAEESTDYGDSSAGTRQRVHRIARGQRGKLILDKPYFKVCY